MMSIGPMTPEAHKYATAAGSLCFVTTENGEQEDIYNLTTFLGVQRSLCLEEVIDDSSSTRVEFPKRVDNLTRDMLERCMATCGKSRRSKSQEETPCTKSSISPGSTRILQAVCRSETGLAMRFFDLVDMRKFTPMNCVTGRWVLTIKTDKQGNFLRAKARLATTFSWIFQATDAPALVRCHVDTEPRRLRLKSWIFSKKIAAWPL